VGNDRTLAVAAILFLTGCAGPRDEAVGEAAAAIQGGEPDGRDAAVVGVALLNEDGHIHQTCSGTLIAPNLVLTAQHCVAETNPFVNCGSSEFGPVTTPDRIRVTTSASMWSHETHWLHAAAVLSPPGTRRVCGHDVALVVLAACVDRSRAAPLPPLLDASPQREEPYAAIGYGITSDGDDDAGLRRRRDALRVVCVGGSCSSGQVAEDEWRGDHGICSGDSGGPAIDGRGFVIGVTSRGPSGCEAPIYGALPGHAPWLRAVARRAALDGDYADLPWASDDSDESRITDWPDSPAPSAAASCATGRPVPGPRSGGILAALALLAARRARGRGVRSRG